MELREFLHVEDAGLVADGVPALRPECPPPPRTSPPPQPRATSAGHSCPRSSKTRVASQSPRLAATTRRRDRVCSPAACWVLPKTGVVLSSRCRGGGTITTRGRSSEGRRTPSPAKSLSPLCLSSAPSKSSLSSLNPSSLPSSSPTPTTRRRRRRDVSSLSTGGLHLRPASPRTGGWGSGRAAPGAPRGIRGKDPQPRASTGAPEYRRRLRAQCGPSARGSPARRSPRGRSGRAEAPSPGAPFEGQRGPAGSAPPGPWCTVAAPGCFLDLHHAASAHIRVTQEAVRDCRVLATAGGDERRHGRSPAGGSPVGAHGGRRVEFF